MTLDNRATDCQPDPHTATLRCVEGFEQSARSVRVETHPRILHGQEHPIALLGVTEDGASVEVAMASRDSVIGFPGIMRINETAFRAQAQVAGAALRISARRWLRYWVFRAAGSVWRQAYYIRKG